MLSINVAVCEVILVGFVIRGINDEVKNWFTAYEQIKVSKFNLCHRISL
jgi:hypothetical protein